MVLRLLGHFREFMGETIMIAQRPVVLVVEDNKDLRARARVLSQQCAILDSGIPLDGLRLDATQQIFDNSSEHILAAITQRVRDTAGSRKTIVGENEPQDVRLLCAPERGGFGLDATMTFIIRRTSRLPVAGILH